MSSDERRAPKKLTSNIPHPWTFLMVPMLLFLWGRACVMRCALPFCSIAGYGTALPILMRSMQRCTSRSADRDDPAILISRSRGLAAACSALGHPTSVLSSLFPIIAIKKKEGTAFHPHCVCRNFFIHARSKLQNVLCSFRIERDPKVAGSEEHASSLTTRSCLVSIVPSQIHVH